MPNKPITISPKHFLKHTFKSGIQKLNKVEKQFFNAQLGNDLKKKLSTWISEAKTATSKAVLDKAVNSIVAMPMEIDALAKLKVGELMKTHLQPALEKVGLSATEINEVKATLKAKENISIDTLLGLDNFTTHPIVLAELRKTQLVEVANIMKLADNEAFITVMTAKDLDWEIVTTTDFDDLVENKTITLLQRNDLLGTAGLVRLTGNNFGLIRTLKEEGIITPMDAIKWETADWGKRIKKSMIPEGITKMEYAEDLRLGMELSFPNEYFIERVVNKDFSEEIKLIEKDSKDIKRTAFNNTFRHLIKDDKNEWVTAEETTKRLADLNTFYKNNTSINLVAADLMQPEGFNWKEVNGKNKRNRILAQMRAFQRVHILADNYEIQVGLLNKGFDTARKIVANSYDTFIKTVKTKNITTESARKTYKVAQKMAAYSAHFAESARTYVFGAQNKLHVNNNDTQAVYNDLKKIAGYEELLGNQDFCACKHCRSIFSPAAYFSDLMRFIEKNASNKLPEPKNKKEEYVQIHLRKRRPDLWKLPLTCENTNKEIPYLQVVNEALETFIKTTNQGKDPYALISTSHTSTLLPRQLPLEEVRILLGHFDMTLYDLYEQLGIEGDRLLQEKLQLSDVALSVIVGDHDDKILQRFGLKDNVDFAELAFNVPSFIEYARISRKELDQLLKTSNWKIITNLEIKKNVDDTDIQKWEEVLTGLTKEHLALIHSYLTLWRKTDWTIPELNLILKSINSGFSLTPNKIKKSIVLELSKMLLIQEKLGLTVEQLVVMKTNIPEQPIKENQPSLLERLFSEEHTKLSTSEYVINTPVVLNLKLYKNEIPRLLAGLGINESELQTLADFFKIKETTALNEGSLSKFYRYVLVARGLEWSIQELVWACQLLGLRKALKDKLDDYSKLFELADWLKESPFSIEDLWFVLKKQEKNGTNYKWTEEEIKIFIRSVQKTIPIPDFTKLSPIPNKKEQKEIKGKIAAERKRRLPNAVRLKFEFEDDTFYELLKSFFESSFEAPSLKNLFKKENEIPKGALTYLTDLMNEFKWLEFTLKKLNFSDESKSFLVNYSNSIFGIKDGLKKFSYEQLKALSHYAKLAKTIDKEKELHDSLIDANLNPLSLYAKNWEQPINRLLSLKPLLPINPITAGIKLKALSDLSALLNLNGTQLQIILENDSSLEKTKNIQKIILAAFTSKYTEETERNEKIEPYIDKINTLKRDVLADFIMGQNKGNKDLKFSDLNDLYAYFLLDVEMSGCFRTSRIRAAISSLQFYTHRCIANLEQSESDKNIRIQPSAMPQDEWEWRKNYRVWEANRKVFLYPENYIEPDLRNNKSHLFKELEVELLQEDVTLETAEAAYKKYMAGFVELAKLRYAGAYYHEPREMNKADVSNRKEKACYTIKGEVEKSMYYLFARTHTDPYQYFYRTYEPIDGGEGIWSNWIKMEVAIEAEEVSALIYMGKLYVFWTEVRRKEVTKFEDGDSKSDGTIFTVYAKYTFLKEDGQWSVPQKVTLDEIFATKTTIFNRVLVKQRTDEEKETEYGKIVEKFEKEVFKKLYAYIQNSKLRIALFWTEGYGIRKIDKFLIPKQTKTKSKNKRRNWVFEIQPFEITVADKTFPYVEKKRITVKKVKKNNNKVKNTFSGEAEFEFNLTRPHISKTKVKILILNPALLNDVDTNPTKAIEVDLDYTIKTENAYWKSYELSLSQNRIINNPLELNIDNFRLDRELGITFINDQPFTRYIENGTIEFTKKRKIIWEDCKTNQAVLSLRSFESFPIATILTDELSETIYTQGIETFLSSETQNRINQAGQDFKNDSYKAYYWELFFHIPFLIANHLNANQKFKDAAWWYQRIFNPTNASDDKDSYWEFSRFKNLGIDTLKEIITNDAAFKVYQEDPFDPHAIASLRLNAYQKAIVMKYIDNLLDWGDYLFTRDTRESIGEAMQKYILAKDILGKRPAQLGDCELTDENTRYKDLTFESDFLANVENYVWQVRQELEYAIKPIRSSKFLEGLVFPEIKFEAPTIDELLEIKDKVGIKPQEDLPFDIGGNTPEDPLVNPGNPLDRMESNNISRFSNRLLLRSNELASNGTKIDLITAKGIPVNQPVIKPIFILDWILEKELAFCIPNNIDLLGYWDRVADRMYKIRHCMNISGIRRSLALYDPPIDPALLVRATAAGLSLQDIRETLLTPSNQPHYRFNYLIEKARQYTQVVQSFGSSLLSALEKKDGEELTLIRSVHEQNILRMSERIKRKQLEESQVAMKNMKEMMRNIENRLQHYTDLIDNDLNNWERIEQSLRHRANIMQGIIPLSHGLARIGSFFRGVFGLSNSTPGESISESSRDSAATLASIVQGMQAIAGSAGILGSNKRREQDWKFQKRTAEIELKGIEQQLILSEIRIKIAEKDLEIHEKQMEQSKAIYDFYRNKFTNLGLYDFMATNLNRLYRQAYNLAYNMAKQAEKAYQLEQNSKERFFIEGNNWDASKAGLVAGDRLLIQLMALEKDYMEKNVRRQEITQTFSVLQINPAALITLRQKGSCSFKIPQIAYELAYPGQYKRLIKSVRVTIPSIVGPYTNVSAKLSLVKSEIEMTSGAELTPRDVIKNQSISLSGGLNDAGVFELNYRDERYLPFEEAGAISMWQLDLPKNFRAFNYDTISDVLMTVSYTAVQGNQEEAEEALERLNQLIKGQTYSKLISLRYDFPNVYRKLLNTINGEPQKVLFELTKEHFPIYFKGEMLTLKKSSVLFHLKNEEQEIGDFKTGVIDNLNGSLIGNWGLDTGRQELKNKDLDDILILFEYAVEVRG